ncbi:hypothetical protein M752DRAFT_32814 [Aspergillus phoenicis ATCC 13157]|uniref:Uncharacterized protein n=1 Tax=Aspergillus phoenicis ATCC 13157 TaxID=1353007 RepID=A0A370PGG5_ASPPH|nr:hypothetical protein M752DRAFT_32814 [Aspergillus phoenicis ATCC 13157]
MGGDLALSYSWCIFCALCQYPAIREVRAGHQSHYGKKFGPIASLIVDRVVVHSKILMQEGLLRNITRKNRPIPN